MNRAMDAMFSIEEMFCNFMWLLAIVDDELWYKRKLPCIEPLISEQLSPLCSWSLSLIATLIYVDLLLKNCAPLDMESIAPF